MDKTHYDIIILGGGIAGSLSALEIFEKCPHLNILMLEKSVSFHKKVGESCADVTSIFFRRSTLLPIIEKQLKKTGLRFWFHEKKHHSLSQFDEYSSPSYKSIANGWQLNRGEFDQDLFDECEKRGITTLRPCEVEDLETSDFHNVVKVNDEGKKIEFTCTWLIDASGRNRIMTSKLGWLYENKNLLTGSIWAHYKNLKPGATWDFRESAVLDRETVQPRFNVTGHFMRHGLWWWHIPLNDNTVSLGVVYDKSVHTEKNPRILFQNLIDHDPALKVLVNDASYEQLYHYPQLSYLPHQMYSKGQLSVGDAAGFLDPLFSPGIEMTIQQILYFSLIFKSHDLKSSGIDLAFKNYEKKFIQSLKDRSFTYEDKYKVMGSYDVFSVWTSMDFIGYYFFHIFPASLIPSWLKRPVMLKGVLKPIYAWFKWRYLTICSFRHKKGITSNSLKSDITYSRVKVSKFPKLLMKYVDLPILWLFRYLRLEGDYFIEKYAANFLQKKKLGSKVHLP